MADDGGDDSDRTITVRAAPLARSVPSLGHYIAYTADDLTHRARITPGGLTIGRTPPCEIVLPYPEISRRHCRIELDGEGAFLTDLGSTNGSFVDGHPVQGRARLRNGSQVSLGSFPLRYERRDLQDVAREAELAADLRRAMEYVRAILPPPLAEGPVRADWCFVPCAQLAGDAFGYQFLDDQHFAGFLIDVSGHGIGSAMHAANVANTLRRGALPGVDPRDPAQVAAGLNALFPMEEHNELFLTMWYFVYALESRVLRFCSAGHHAAYMLEPGGAMHTLQERAPMIGMLPMGRWNSGEVVVARDARLYLFSDGAFEVGLGDGTMWGMENLARVIGDTPRLALPESQRLYHAVRTIAPAGPLEDDFSAVVFTFP